jgi:hypothetical protein
MFSEAMMPSAPRFGGGGGGGGSNQAVYWWPRGGGVDDWPTLNALILSEQSRPLPREIVALPGEYHCQSELSALLHMQGKPQDLVFSPGSKIIASLSSVTSNPFPAVFGTDPGLVIFGTDPHQSIAVLAKSGSLVLTVGSVGAPAPITVGSWINTGSFVRRVLSITPNGGNFDLRLDYPIYSDLPIVSPVYPIVHPIYRLRIIGYGCIITGTASRYWSLSGVAACEVQGFMVSDEAGVAAQLGSWDIGSVDCKYKDIDTSLLLGGTASQSLNLEATTNCAIEGCRLSMANLAIDGGWYWRVRGCHVRPAPPMPGRNESALWLTAYQSTNVGGIVESDNTFEGTVQVGQGDAIGAGSYGVYDVTMDAIVRIGDSGTCLWQRIDSIGLYGNPKLYKSPTTSSASCYAFIRAGKKVAFSTFLMHSNDPTKQDGKASNEVVGILDQGTDRIVVGHLSSLGLSLGYVNVASGGLDALSGDVDFTIANGGYNLWMYPQAATTIRLRDFRVVGNAGRLSTPAAAVTFDFENLVATGANQDTAAGSTLILRGASSLVLTGAGKYQFVQTPDVATKTVTVADVSLTISDMLSQSVETLGALTGNRSVVDLVVAVGREFIAINGNTGPFTTTFKSSALDPGVVLTQGKSAPLRVNSAGAMTRTGPDT